MDARIEQAQQLFWEIQLLRSQGAQIKALPRLRTMAKLHEERSRELLSSNNPDGWTDLYASVTAWGEAGMKHEASKLIAEGRQAVDRFPAGRQNLEQQLGELETWLNALTIEPSLTEFDRQLPLSGRD